MDAMNLSTFSYDKYSRVSLPCAGESCCFLAEKMHKLNERVYDLYFSTIKRIVEMTAGSNYRPIGLILGTIMLDLIPAITAASRRILYQKNPVDYGLNAIKQEHQGHAPVILLHGRMGKWTDLAPLAFHLQKAHFSVFVMDLEESSCPSETDRKRINEQIECIQRLYQQTFNQSCPAIDLVGHSLGGDMALYTSFTSECSFIEDREKETLGDLKIHEGYQPESNPLVGRVITLGMPSNAIELAWAKAAGKAHLIFNVTAKYDVIMGKKECALAKELPDQVIEVPSGHLGMLNSTTYKHVESLLQKTE